MSLKFLVKDGTIAVERLESFLSEYLTILQACLAISTHCFISFHTVPFRDSTLTRLLKNALGGNSKTIMVSSTYFLKPVPTFCKETSW